MERPEAGAEPALFADSADVLGLLLLGLQHLFLTYMVIVYVPMGFEPPTSMNLKDLWWYTAENGHGVLAEFSYVNTLFVIYLWISYRSQGSWWWQRASGLLVTGMALLFLASQHALLRLMPIPVVSSTLRVIELTP